MTGREVETDKMIRREAIERPLVQEAGAEGVASAILEFPELLRLSAAEIEQRASEAITAAEKNLFAENDRVARIDRELRSPRNLEELASGARLARGQAIAAENGDARFVFPREDDRGGEARETGLRPGHFARFFFQRHAAAGIEKDEVLPDVRGARVTILTVSCRFRQFAVPED